jgi:sugar phosphate isomerase/epimerase
VKTSLNGARLGADKLTFLEFVDLASRHGFDGIDFGITAAMKAADELGGPHLLKDYLKEKGVAPAVFGMDVDWRKEQSDFELGVAALVRKAEFANLIGATRCVTWMPPSVNDDVTKWDSMAVRRFNEVGRILQEHGIRFGLEWVGPHHLRAGGANAMGANPWIHTLDDTLLLIQRIGLPNMGLLVDSYHCYTTGVAEDRLAALTDADIVHVHINDAPKGVGPTGARDGERVLPGAGEIDLTSFLRGINRAGYQGYVAAEVLAPQNLADTPDAAATLVRQSLRGLGL